MYYFYSPSILSFVHIHFVLLFSYSIFVFVSLNSSFIECVRKHYITLTSYHHPNSASEDIICSSSVTSVTGCSTSSTILANLRLLSHSMKFVSCKWSSCNADDAGAAIKCTGINTVLAIEKCSFISCSAYEMGGAIYTSSIHTLDVQQSLFYKGSTSTKVNNQGSGAIWINCIQEKLSVSENSFISCTSKASGGASIVKDCSENIRGQAIQYCRNIDCNATDESPDGGAVWISSNSALIGLLNCLFSKCNSYNGGAVYHYLSHYQSGSNPIRYCFFNKNTGENGNDATFYKFSPDNDQPVFLHCYSTTELNRIGYYDNNNWYQTDVDWHP